MPRFAKADEVPTTEVQIDDGFVVVIDNDIREALILAVKSGVKVKLIYGDNNTKKKDKTTTANNTAIMIAFTFNSFKCYFTGIKFN